MTAINQADAVRYGTGKVDAVYANGVLVWKQFKPTDLSGCVVWLDASSMSLANGAAVSSWTNLAGAPHPTVLSSPAPTFRTNATPSGGPAVRIAAGNTGRFVFGGLNVDKNYTLVYVGRKWSAAAGRVIAANYSNAAQPNILYGYWDTRWECAHVEAWLTPDTVVTAGTTWKMYSGDATSTAVARLFSNGTLIRSGAATPPKGLSGTLCLGGHDTTGTEVPDAEHAEVVLYNRKLTDADRQKVESYMRKKWGIT